MIGVSVRVRLWLGLGTRVRGYSKGLGKGVRVKGWGNGWS